MLLMLGAVLLAAGTAASDSGVAGIDSTEAVSPRIVRRMADVIVRAQFHDPLSSEAGHLLTSPALRTLPASRLTDVLATKAGVVVHGGQLTVRGGRPGETVTLLSGLPLQEPRRSRPLELPLMAIRSAELLSGGLDPEHPGVLAGVVSMRTVDPADHYQGAVMWQSDGRRSTNYDRLAGRVGGPIPGIGLGAVIAAEAELHDTHHPYLRTPSRNSIAGVDFGWRAANKLLGYAKLAPLEGPDVSLEVILNRRVEQPFNPMFSIDGYVTTCADPFCLSPGFSANPEPGYLRYNAADHAVQTDDRSAAVLLSWQEPTTIGIASASAGWIESRRLTTVGGNDDESYLDRLNTPFFGTPDSPTSEPFFVYLGDEPFYQKSSTRSWLGRADFGRNTPKGSRVKVGLGGRYDEVQLREIDMSIAGLDLDTLRSYRAYAPSAFAYAQGRWVFEGLVLNGGLRAEYFTAGPQAEMQAFGSKADGIWIFSPRLGVAYPISTRDVLSLAYVRAHQTPALDFLYDNRTREISHRQQLGNPALEPVTMISYQAAVKHSISSEWSLQGGIFYRDLFGLIGTREVLLPGATRTRPRYENADAGHAAGIEVSLTLSRGDRLHSELHYTFMEAFGTQSREEGQPFGSRSLSRLTPITQNPLDWDQRHAVVYSGWIQEPRSWSIAWSTRIGSGLPWTPRALRTLSPEFELTNTRRLKFEEMTNVRATWNPGRGPIGIGLEVRNLSNRRNELAATVLGYPHPSINTIFDDYAAYRTQTGNGGGAYWNDANGDGQPGWRPVNDPRLVGPPRTILLTLSADW